MSRRFYSISCAILSLLLAGFVCGKEPAPDGWGTAAPRDELRPSFSFQPQGGPDGHGSFVIEADAQPGRHGYWTKTFPLTGGRYYGFHVLRKVDGLEQPRRNVVVRIAWENDAGKAVLTDEPVIKGMLETLPARAEPEFPAEGATDSRGWTEMSGVYLAPAKATRAVVELHLQWVSNARVEWNDVSFVETA